MKKVLQCRGLGDITTSGGGSIGAGLNGVNHAAVKSALECELEAVRETARQGTDRATLWRTVLGM